MVFYNELIVLKEYTKRTKYEFWKDIRVGDKLIVGLSIEKNNCFKGKSYQNRMMVHNKTSVKDFVNYPSSVLMYLSNLDLQLVNPTVSNIDNVINNGMSEGYKMKACDLTTFQNAFGF